MCAVFSARQCHGKGVCQVHWGIERSRSELGLLRSSINSFLIVVWVLIEPFAGTMFTKDQLPYASSLAAPVAASPLRKIMISGVLVRRLMEAEEVLTIAPVITRNTSDIKDVLFEIEFAVKGYAYKFGEVRERHCGVLHFDQSQALLLVPGEHDNFRSKLANRKFFHRTTGRQ